ncbi:MAG: TonB-dependent receptor, partial [Sphingomonadales bacterium]
MKKSNIWRTTILSTGLLGLAVTAQAQQEPQAPAHTSSGFELETITVVATRREESLQEVPMSVTAIDSGVLEMEQINAVKDIGSLVPNLLVATGTAGGAKSHPVFTIRGQSQQERGGLADSSVVAYFGDVAIARTQGLNQTLFDIQAIEVVRGPTGTLFGRNSTGGAIIIRPNLPNTDQVEASVGATLAEYGTRNFDGYVNLPIGDRVAVRIGGASNQNDGFVYDERLDRNVNFDDNYSLRGSVLFKLTDTLENVTMVNYFNEDSGGPGGFVRALNPTGLIATVGPAARNYPPAEELIDPQNARGPHRIASGVPEFTRMETIDVHNTTTWNAFENVTVKNIFGYRHVEGHLLANLSGMSIPILRSEIFDDAEQWSNEFQVYGEAGNLDWIAGAYYFNETGGNNAYSAVFAVDTGDLISPPTTIEPGRTNNHQQFDNTSYAAFAELTYDMSDFVPGLSVTAGGRQTWDKREATVLNNVWQTSCAFTLDNDNDPNTPEVNPGFGPDCRLDLDEKFNDFTYNLAVQYEPDDATLFYGSLRRGFRAGGFPARANQEVGLRVPFEPEYVRAWEVGVKRDWDLGGMFLRTNLAGFYSDYTNVQRQLVDTTSGNPFTVVANAAEARIQGLELEVLAQVTPEFQISGFWGYTDTK